MRNKYRIEEDTVYIQLDHKDGTYHETTVSISKLQKLLEFDIKWSYKKRPNERTAYVLSSPYINGKTTCILLHRFLLDAPDGLVVDHFNGDGLNNADNNLRLVTKAINCQNRITRSPSKSGIRGVHWHKPTNSWRVLVYKDNKHYSHGYYKTLEEAAKVAEKVYAELYEGVKMYAKP